MNCYVDSFEKTREVLHKAMKHDKITVGSIHDTTSLKMGLNGDGGGGYLIISRKFLTNIIFLCIL